MTSRRADWWCVAILAALPVLLFADVLFLGSNFYIRDLFRYHYPMKSIVRETIASGSFPFWNRAFGGGQPMAANPAYEIFYPPQWLIFVGSFSTGFALHILAHVYLALLGMYAFLRSLALRVEASFAGAVSFGLGGFLLGTMTNLPTFFVWSWAGVSAWAVLRLMQRRDGRAFAIAAIVLAMPMLVGEPVALAQLWALLVAGSLAAQGRRALRPLLLVVAAVLLLSAVQLLPMAGHLRDSARAAGFRYEVVTDYSMAPIRPLELLAPRLFGVPNPDAHAFWGVRMFERGLPYLVSLSCGFAIVLFALAGLAARIRGTKIAIATIFASYVLALGSHTPLFRVLYAAGLRSIRYPEKFAAMGIVAMIVFGAGAIDACLNGSESVRRAARGLALAFGGLLLLAGACMTRQTFLAIWALPPAASPLAATARVALLLPGITALAWWVLLRFGMQHRLRTIVGLALLLVDLLPFANQVTPRMGHEFFTPPPAARALPAGATLFHRGEWLLSDPNRLRFEQLSSTWTARNGLRPLTPSSWGMRNVLEPDIDETYLLPTHELLAAMQRLGNSGFPLWAERFAPIAGATHIASWRDASVAAREADSPEALGVVEVQPVPSAHYYLAHSIVVTPGVDQALDWLRTHEPKDVALIPSSFASAVSAARPIGNANVGVVMSAIETANEATVTTESQQPSLLVLTVTRHRDWQVAVDGRAVAMVPANFAFQSVLVPAGRHRVTMRYRNPLIAAGAAITAITLMALLAAAWIRRPGERPEPTAR